MTGEASFAHYVVAGAVVLAAGLALFGARRMVAVIGFLIFGTLLSLYWALISAPDVALAEAAIGAGVTGALFVAAVTALGRSARIGPQGPSALAASLGVSAVLAVVLGLALTRAAVGSAGEPPGLGERVAEALPETGVEHPVTGVLLNLRSLDTLLEMVVLLAAAAIALSFLRPSPTTPAARQPLGPVLDGFVRLVLPVVIALAAWLLFAGSSQPGGAFQSGAVVAAVLILLHLAGVRPLQPSRGWLLLLAFGVAAFIAVGVGGLISGGAWLELRGDLAFPVTVALETALTLTIGASLATVFAAVSQPRPADDEPADEAGNDHAGDEEPRKDRAQDEVTS